MLKIKSNTNEFTIIFFWEDLKENKCWKILCSALSVQHPFSVSAFFFFSFQRRTPLFLFCFLFPTLLLCSSPLFLFFLCVALYFSAQNTFFFSPNVFQPKNTFFNPKRFYFSPKLFFFLFFSSSATLLFFFFLLYFFFWFSPLFFLF